jgi:hypothetical protein
MAQGRSIDTGFQAGPGPLAGRGGRSLHLQARRPHSMSITGWSAAPDMVIGRDRLRRRAVTVAAFVLGIIGTVLAAGSLAWQVWSFILQGARPKLTPIVGLLTAGGLVSNDATRDVRDSLKSAASQVPPGPLVIGMKVVNDGRAPFHVTGWAVRADPSAVSFVVLDNQIGGPTVPCDIPPSGEAIFVTELTHASGLAAGGEAVDGKPQQITLTVSSGSRKFTTKPVHPASLTLK